MPGQGVTSMFNFGQSFGILKGICSAMHLPVYYVRPAKWKKYFNLINSEKDASRTRAIEIFPYFSSQLSKKKDNNKADAILIASFFYETYQKEEASKILGTWRLDDTTIAVTLEPDVMCSGAIVLSRVKKLIYGSANLKSGGAFSIDQISGIPACVIIN